MAEQTDGASGAPFDRESDLLVSTPEDLLPPIVTSSDRIQLNRQFTSASSDISVSIPEDPPSSPALKPNIVEEAAHSKPASSDISVSIPGSPSRPISAIQNQDVDPELQQSDSNLSVSLPGSLSLLVSSLFSLLSADG